MLYISLCVYVCIRADLLYSIFKWRKFLQIVPILHAACKQRVGYLNRACSFACRSLTEDSARCLNWVLVPLISETRCKTRHAPLSCPPNSTGLICSQSRGLYWGVRRAIVQRRFWNAMTRWHRVGISGTLFEVWAPKANKSGPPNSIGASLECRYTPVYTRRFVCLIAYCETGNAFSYNFKILSSFCVVLSIYLSKICSTVG